MKTMEAQSGYFGQNEKVILRDKYRKVQTVYNVHQQNCESETLWLLKSSE